MADLLKKKLGGCYITVPPMLIDPDLAVDTAAIQRHVAFLMERGINAGNDVLLAGGVADDFSTMSFDERELAAPRVIQAAGGRIPVAMGAQTTSTRELKRLAKKAASLDGDFVNESCPPLPRAVGGHRKNYTSNIGYLGKLCMERVGPDSSPLRPPTRDVREKFCERARHMMSSPGCRT